MRTEVNGPDQSKLDPATLSFRRSWAAETNAPAETGGYPRRRAMGKLPPPHDMLAWPWGAPGPSRSLQAAHLSRGGWLNHGTKLEPEHETAYCTAQAHRTWDHVGKNANGGIKAPQITARNNARTEAKHW